MSEILAGMITEAELLKLLNIKPSELNSMRREKGLPFVKISMRSRAYLEKDVLEWMQGRRIILNRAEKSESAV